MPPSKVCDDVIQQGARQQKEARTTPPHREAAPRGHCQHPTQCPQARARCAHVVVVVLFLSLAWVSGSVATITATLWWGAYAWSPRYTAARGTHLRCMRRILARFAVAKIANGLSPLPFFHFVFLGGRGTMDSIDIGGISACRADRHRSRSSCQTRHETDGKNRSTRTRGRDGHVGASR